MYERLIFNTRIEQRGTKEIISDTFPLVKLWDAGDFDDPFITDMELNQKEESFFEWSLETIGAGFPIITYCFNMSLQLLFPPPWMSELLFKRGYNKHKQIG